MVEIVVLCGIPGSGKSTFAKTRFPEYRRINLDTLKTRHKEYLAILEAINTSKNIIIDSTNTTRNARKRYVDLAAKFGIPIRAIYLKCPLEIALQRNAERVDNERVPPFVLKMYFKKLEPPNLSEGLHGIQVIETG